MKANFNGRCFLVVGHAELVDEFVQMLEMLIHFGGKDHIDNDRA